MHRLHGVQSRLEGILIFSVLYFRFTKDASDRLDKLATELKDE